MALGKPEWQPQRMKDTSQGEGGGAKSLCIHGPQPPPGCASGDSSTLAVHCGAGDWAGLPGCVLTLGGRGALCC